MIPEFALLIGIAIGYIFNGVLSMNTIDEYRSKIYRLELSNANLRKILSDRRELMYSSDKERGK